MPPTRPSSGPTSRGGARGNRGSPNRSTSSRTICTCCRPDRACAPCRDHTGSCGHSLSCRTTRNAVRRRDAREPVPGHTRNSFHSSYCRNVCISLPYFISSTAHYTIYRGNWKEGNDLVGVQVGVVRRMGKGEAREMGARARPCRARGYFSEYLRRQGFVNSLITLFPCLSW